MSKTVPSIQKFMTTSPHSIGADQTLAGADEMMKKYGIRHLPVLEGGQLVGLITDRDLKFIKGFKDVNPALSKVKDIAVSDVFTVDPDAMLDEVCEEMAFKKYGCAVVMSNSKLVGIFTWVDGLLAMSDLLKTRLK